jgi:tetratricopeptide (TPR) repeat protein
MNRPTFRLIFCLVLVALTASPFCAQLVLAKSAQTEGEVQAFSTLQGVVRDAQQRPIAGATVALESNNRTLAAITDNAGAYRFSIPEGVYSLHVTMAGYEAEDIPSIAVGKNESKTCDLKLVASLAPLQKPTPRISSPAQPEFFDEPHFTVAGVTDTTNLGGHGSSETVVRNRDSLSRAAASLNAQPSPDAHAASANAAMEKSLRQAVEQSPESFAANYQLGKLLLGENKSAEALPFLQVAFRLNNIDPDSHYELALALFMSGDYVRARTELLSLLDSGEKSRAEKAEANHLIAQADEKLGDPLQAVGEFQKAAELNPSEENLFDWGTELLLHHAAQPAVEVLAKGNRLFPTSARMLTALSTAWYALGFYDRAAQRLCEASDLNPADPNPYIFMGKMEATEAIQSEAIAQRLKRFAELQPGDALANFYYAVSLWKGRKTGNEHQTAEQVKSLLMKSVQVDPKLGLAYLQLGIVYADQKKTDEAIAAYQRAIAVTPGLEQAHYRLAQAYRQVGEQLKAQAELGIYQKISDENTEETRREHHETQEFVYRLQERDPTPRPQ